MSEFNDRIIEEFRANGGKVGGPFEGAQMLLVTVTGRRTGKPRTFPLVYSTDGSNLVIAASNGGADTDPVWLGNIAADPKVTVEVGERTFEGTARIESEGSERDRLYAAHAALMPGFDDYQKGTSRVIPVVVLEPAEA
ncbi:nitroreductase family deazaflavin-dependent oxidoreductase [Actinoalloteichus hymeniacidonis]|uniref:Deazaflavin-dependent oxidoreductase, nitroreductase family n=1 Tax=Actinoalloteichus hymeniacidonis TaxID=340345 RepID=A0AAC9HQ56_9PSEU|nr:nitroreductase family deazaflavin-dependent oxidoreductase [Actinoalloteichus hymeniacidonis]AOS63318.1 deazaflavin-dependent oxidoreductase, nitroreductase family [Actinoalloteichus hymeniacidonis]MBB5908643.1 deazaflavin-dependent oxidoreductase (nitroreductase family) [Actinoalloteichus hymeniacidonis]